ncbi:interleukin-13 receptor subunit alpha-1-like [Sphaeramia orbicularis]|uniref:Interleukin-13 receptor subunit alpha-1-like n=1 Tax=Sphaeramia orbicularis TaxID=375764 RepID=A0A673AJ61_9TELE|nr:interleukin-13 receptor subunit alpha-1-like [Sphaeramia orbicularis]
MTSTWGFCSVLCVAIIRLSHGETGHLPPPTELTYTWLDSLTVNVSWKEPVLPDGCEIDHYEVKVQDTEEIKVQGFPEWTGETHFHGDLLTEKSESAQWISSVRAFGRQSCKDLKSTTVTKPIKTKKPKAKVVEDFKCYINKSHLECSWKAVNPSQELSLSFRLCGQHKAPINECDRIYTSGERTVCHIKNKKEKFVQEDICMIATTDTGLSTFMIKYVLPSPKMSISEDGSNLLLKIEESEVAPAHCWRYNVCYTECNTHKPCQESSENVIKVPYDNHCRYEFRYEVRSDRSCVEMRSDWSDVVTYGDSNPDMMMTVVFIIVPVVLSACVILSCYCFRRHSHIICPTIPDPSAIFKEMMMMNGNKDVKPITSMLYSPEEEEQCKITLVAEDSDLHQNS